MTGDAMREVIARVIDPSAWGDCDDFPTARHGQASHRRTTLVRADAILAAITAAPASARLALARAITPDTHAVVPVEASEKMLTAGFFARDVGLWGPGGIYRAMIAAARKESDDGR